MTVPKNYRSILSNILRAFTTLWLTFRLGPHLMMDLSMALSSDR